MNLASYIGRPWSPTFDCYELMHCVRTDLGFDTPRMSDRIRHAIEGGEDVAPPAEWVQIARPVLGCVVRMGAAHVGVCIGVSRVIHCSQRGGVRIDRIRLLEQMGEDVTYWELKHG